MSVIRRASVAVKVDDPSRVGEARRRASGIAADLDFDEARRGAVALVVAEAASNLSRHAERGELIVQGRRDDLGARLEVLAVDRGPGMADVGRCLQDGYSTAGSMGTGLGAIRRIADEFAVHSRPGRGTVLWSRLHHGPAAGPDLGHGLAIGAVNLPAVGEEVCGDDWDAVWRDEACLILVVDGLGHGPTAAEAAEAAVDAFRSLASDDPAAIVEATHPRLRPTRGAAMAVARLDHRRGEIRYAGAGNIAGAIIDPATGRASHLVSQHGTVGHALRKVREDRHRWPEDAAVILHSDGLSGRWDLARDPDLGRLAPGLIAGLLHRDHTRGRDDVTVVVARRNQHPYE